MCWRNSSRQNDTYRHRLLALEGRNTQVRLFIQTTPGQVDFSGRRGKTNDEIRGRGSEHHGVCAEYVVQYCNKRFGNFSGQYDVVPKVEFLDLLDHWIHQILC